MVNFVGISQCAELTRTTTLTAVFEKHGGKLCEGVAKTRSRAIN